VAPVDRQSRPARPAQSRPSGPRAILDALEQLIGDEPAGDLRPLAGRRDEARLRVGDWRVLLKRDSVERIIHVRRVLPGGRAYDR
jgi:mRNA-degrading endonuclease RelE of RelBE toxin-antitoxin system